MKTAVSSYQIETSHAETEYDINRPLSAHPANPQCIDHQDRQGHINAFSAVSAEISSGMVS
jgi:hypothetical protein